MAGLTGASWALLVLVAAWRHRPAPGRVRRLTAELVRTDRGSAPPSRTAADGKRLRRLVLVGVVMAATLLVAPLLAPAGVAAVWALPRLGRRRDRRRAEAALRASLPEVVDLLVLAAGAGMTVPLAVNAVALHGSGPVAAALASAGERVRAGSRLADALDELPVRLGERVRPLVVALTASERYGAPLLPSLERLALEVRADRRRSAEAAARQVPVKLLFPLVVCTLPAFCLLTVVPLVAGALSGLSLP